MFSGNLWEAEHHVWLAIMQHVMERWKKWDIVRDEGTGVLRNLFVAEREKIEKEIDETGCKDTKWKLVVRNSVW